MSRRVTMLPLILALTLAGPGLPGWAAVSRPTAPVEKPAAVKTSLPAPSIAPQAPAPVNPAATSLQTVVEAVAEEQKIAAPSREASAAAEFFDVRSPKAIAAAVAVAAAGAASGGAALPAAYALARFSAESPKISNGKPSTLKSRLIDQAEAHAAIAPTAFAMAAANFMTQGSVLLPVLIAGISLAMSVAMEDSVARVRARVVGGWQASHDQKFRVDPTTGRLKDVRGTNKQYGKDRYERYAPGEVSRLERLWYRFAAASIGLYWTGLTGDYRTLIFSAALAAGFAAHDLYRFKRRQSTGAMDAEDAAFARRFNPD